MTKAREQAEELFKPKTVTRKSDNNLYELLASMQQEIKELRAERQAPSRGKPKVEKERKVYLKTEKVEGTGYKFWQVHKPIHVSQSAADSGRYYKSEKGRRIRVFFVNKNFSQSPIVGAIEIEPGVWEARTWNYNGGTRAPYSHGDNIVGFWQD